MSFHLYVPGRGKTEDWKDKITAEEFASYAVEYTHPRLVCAPLYSRFTHLVLIYSVRVLTRLAGSVSRLRLVNRPVLEEWVHHSGRMIAIGGAAHPYLVITF